MKATTAIGIVVAILGLFFGMLMEGGNPAAFINTPALLIIVGGTLGVTFAGTSVDRVKAWPTLWKKAVSDVRPNLQAQVDQMVTFAEKARREGLLALEAELEQVDDSFTRKGVGLIVDGTDSSVVEGILRSEIDGMALRHGKNAKLFSTLGGFAPTLGILGTVLSLVHVLENLSNPGALGHSIAGAFIATLYGVGSANLIFLPISNRLKGLSETEVLYREMIVEGVLALQAGDNPSMLAERLDTFLEPGERGQAKQAPAAAAAEPVLQEAA